SLVPAAGYNTVNPGFDAYMAAAIAPALTDLDTADFDDTAGFLEGYFMQLAIGTPKPGSLLATAPVHGAQLVLRGRPPLLPSRRTGRGAHGRLQPPPHVRLHGRASGHVRVGRPRHRRAPPTLRHPADPTRGARVHRRGTGGLQRAGLRGDGPGLSDDSE